MQSIKDLKNLNKRALIIAAHPDDETIFMGGTIAEFKGWRWTILCVTDCDERYNKRRRREFLQACRIYNRGGGKVKPVMLEVVKRKGRFSNSEVKKRIGDFIERFGPFDIIFTHERRGDYGHKTHRLIHNIVKELRPPNLYSFFTPLQKKFAPLLQKIVPSNIQLIKLSPASRRTKRQALDTYLKGSQKSNLLKLKRLINYALNTKAEYFKLVR